MLERVLEHLDFVHQRQVVVVRRHPLHDPVLDVQQDFLKKGIPPVRISRSTAMIEATKALE